jgi:phosphate transport system substrate-binding protein
MEIELLSIDGVDPTENNIISGLYPIQRDLVICTRGEPVGNVKCFIDWITSDEGQEIVSCEFTPLPKDSRTDYDEPSPLDKQSITVGGSTSIQTIMMMLAEKYKEKFGINVNVTGGGSGVGISNTVNGQFDIGMCSRDLNESETKSGLTSTIIGKDGVAVIINGAGVENLTIEQISDIYSGKINNWKEVGGIDKPIAVIARDDFSGTAESFNEAMVDGWSIRDNVVKYNSSGGVIGAVKIAKGSIGYISIGQLKSL